jgi:hypothetical protein
MNLQKDVGILRLLAALGMEGRGWIVKDHWTGDRCAIGVAGRAEPRRLVYVSTYMKSHERYDYECESPVGPGSTEYGVAERGFDVDFQTLLSVIVAHLSTGGATDD